MTTYSSYPIGSFEPPAILDAPYLKGVVDAISSFPDELERIVGHLSPEQFATKTLPGVWTVAQGIHHIADADINALLRTKAALTSEEPTILPWDEELWARMDDALAVPPTASIRLIRGLRERWACMLRSLDEAQWNRRFFHPESQKHYSVAHTASLYVWHGRHHLAHIEALLKSRAW